MKNPLVDALRQASGDDKNIAVEESRADVAEALPVTNENVPDESMDLELIDPPAGDSAEPAKSVDGSLDLTPGETGKIDEAVNSTGQSIHPAINDTDEPAKSTLESFGPETEEAADLSVEPTASAAVADRASLAATAVLTARGASLEHRAPMLPKIGRLAPILCLIGMSASAGGYFLIDRLSSGSLNEDLDDMSERMSLDETLGGGTGVKTVLPVTDISVIKRTAARNAASAALEEKKTEAQQRRETNDNTRSSTIGSDQGRDNTTVPIGVSRQPVATVDDKAYQLVVAAFDAYRQQDYDVAENNYLKALEIEPNHADALAGLGAVYQQTGRINLATENYQRLLGVDPGNTLAASALISLRSTEVDWDTESELKHLLQRFPLAHHLHFALASYFVDQGRWADARYEFRAAQELAPDNADYNFNLAVSLEQLGDYEGARHYYEAAIATAGGSANVDKQVVAQHLTEMTSQERERL